MPGKSKMISLKKILEKLDENGLLLAKSGALPKEYRGMIRTDSRQIEPGDIFVCISGYVFDGHDYFNQALNRGAVLIVAEKELELNVPLLRVKSSRKSAALLAQLFYGDPTSKFCLIGVTGTNGKTTVVRLVNNLLLKSGKKTGTIGTLGYSIGTAQHKIERTTPDIIQLHEIFFKMVREKVEVVIMEVSSHAVSLDRIFGLKFDLAVFTNLSREHLDFHKTMSEYAAVKFEFLIQTKLNRGRIILNYDDGYGQEFYRNLSDEAVRISFRDDQAEMNPVVTGMDFEGSRFRLNRSDLIGEFSTRLIGEYNIFNLTAALAILEELGYDISDPDLIRTVAEMPEIPGRIQRITEITGRNVFVDYAHTPDALENVLKALRGLKPSRLICLFGAGGERDRGKRPLMLEKVFSIADLAIITNDNPRNESPARIIRDIVGNSVRKDNFWIIRNRKKAISAAISLCGKEDILLLAGKGHETYQIIGEKHYPSNDYKTAIDASETDKTLIKDNGLYIPIDGLMVEICAGISAQDIGFEDREVYFDRISTDSRMLEENSLFLALKGERFDGQIFVSEVLETPGCRAVVRKDFKGEPGLVYPVDDPLFLYGDLARRYRKLFPAKVIAITGSVGKSTTKEYISNILSQSYLVLKTESNENNQIGVPRTLFRLQPEYEYVVLELGSNHPGEIAYLAEICDPEYALVNAIGPSHLEFFGDMDGVYREKSSLLRRKLAARLFPGDESRFTEFEGISCGRNSGNKYRLHSLETDNGHTLFMIDEEQYSIPTPFLYFAHNALFAVGLAKELGLSRETIQEGLNRQLGISWRMEIIRRADRLILADCYNANPDSMKAAIAFWNKTEPDKPHIAIIGDMLELGSLTEKYHREISDLIKEVPSHLVISVGDAARFYRADTHFGNVEELSESDILAELPASSVILVKASHGIGLEKILERI